MGYMIFYVYYFLILVLYKLQYSYPLTISHKNPIHSTPLKIILSTRPCPFSTCQLNPRLILAVSIPKRKFPKAGISLSTLGNTLFSTTLHPLIVYFGQQGYRLYMVRCNRLNSLGIFWFGGNCSTVFFDFRRLEKYILICIYIYIYILQKFL